MKKMFKVLCPITKKDGSTFWMRVGSAFTNKDDSVNVFLDAFPKDGKLQLREFDERDLQRGKGEGPSGDGEPSGFAAGLASLSFPPAAREGEQVPF